MKGAGWLLCGWGMGARWFWSEEEAAWGARDRATLYATRKDAEAAGAKVSLAPGMAIFTAVSADQSDSSAGPRVVWGR